MTVEYRDLGEFVLAQAAVEARGPGDVPVEMTVFQLWSVRDGKVAACRVFTSESEALEAAGLSE
jgi:ketosteroid isomerase-like protein